MIIGRLGFWISRVAVCALICFALATPRALAASFTASTTGNWSSAATWGGAGVPGAGDDATISSGVTVTVDVPVTVAGFSMSNGTLTGSSNLTVTSTFSWTNGTMSGTGSTTIANTVTSSTIGGTGTKYFLRPLNLNANTTYSTTTASYGGNGVTIALGSGVTFDITTDADLYYNCCSTYPTLSIPSTATLQKSGGAATTQVDWIVNNAGTVTATAGTLSLEEGGTGAGAYSVGSGATLAFAGGTHTTTGTVSGAGTLSVTTGQLDLGGTNSFSGDLSVNGGTLNVNGTTSTASLTFSSGTIGGTAALTATTSFSWTGGTMSGTGSTTIANTVTSSAIGGASTKYFLRTLNLNANTTYNTTTASYGGSGAAITLGGGVTFDITTDADLYYNCCSTYPTLTIPATATLQKSAGTTTTQIDWIVSNGGTVNVTSGTLSLEEGGTGAGTYSVGSGATLAFGGGTHTTTGTFSGAGTLSVTTGQLDLGSTNSFSGDLSVNGGTLNVNGTTSTASLTFSSGTIGGTAALTATSAFSWTGGTMSGTGSTTIANTVTSSTIGGASTKYFLRTLNLNASTTYNTTTASYGGSGVTIALGSGVTFDITTDADLYYNCCSTYPTLSVPSTATLQKSGGAGISQIDWIVNNGGTVNVTSGTLSLEEGGTGAGAYSVGTGATLAFGGGTHTTTGTFSGAGTLSVTTGQLDLGGTNSLTGDLVVSSGTANLTAAASPASISVSGGTLNLNGATSTPSLTFSNGTIGGSAALTVTSSFSWTGGTMSGSGSTTIANTVTSSTIGGASTKYFLRTLNLNANTTYSTTTASYGGSGVTITLGSGVTFDITTDADLYYNCCAAYPTLSIGSTATLQKSGGAATTQIDWIVNNGGTVNVTSGTLSLEEGGTGAGAYSVGTGATLAFGGGTHTTTGTFSGAGTLSVTAGQLDLGGTNSLSGDLVVSSGTANLTAAVSPASISVSGGTLNLNGTTSTPSLTLSNGTIGGSAALTVTSSFSWTGGTMSGSGSTTIANTVTSSTIGGASTKYFLRTLNLNADTTYSTTTASYGGSGVTITLGSGVTFDITTDADLYYNCCAAYPTLSIGSTATLQKSGGTGISQIDWIVSNGGTLDVTTGTLSLEEGGTGAGTYSVGTGATLAFSGGTHTTTGIVSGTGTLAVTTGQLDLGGANSFSGDLSVSGGTLNVNGTTSTASLTFSNGTISGTAALTVTTAFSWTGGTMSGGGSTTIANTVTSSTIGGASTKYFLRTLNLNANTTYSTTTGSYGGNGVTITLGSAVTFNITTDADLYYNCCSAYPTLSIGSTATLQKSGGATTTQIDWIVNNAGTVNVTGGTLSLEEGGTGAGAYTVGSGATLAFGGGTHSTTGTFSGAGTLLMTAGQLDIDGTNALTASVTVTGGTLNFNGAAAPSSTSISGGILNVNATTSTSSLTFSGGTLSGTGALTVTTSFSWTGGTMSGSGSTTIAGTVSSSTIGGSGVKYFLRALNINANTVYNPSVYAYGGDAAIITVASGKTLDVQTDQQFYYACCGSNATLKILGTVAKTAGAGTLDLGWILQNDGTLSVTSGTFQATAGGTHTGSFAPGSGAIIRFNGGTHTLSAGSTSGAGKLQLTSGTMTVTAASHNAANFEFAGGTLDGTGTLNVTASFLWTAGTMTGSGATTIAGTVTSSTIGGAGVKYFQRTLNINANTVFNSSVYSYGSGAVVTIGSGATLDLQTDQQFYYNCCSTNATLSIASGGTLAKSAGTGVSQFDWVVDNSGTISATNGTIALAGGGTSTGSFTPGAGTTVRFAGGTHSATGPVSGTGTIGVTGGTVTFSGTSYNAASTDISGGTANFDGMSSTGNFALSNSGILGGTGSLSVTSSFSWTGGSMSGTGSTTIAGTVTSSVIGGSSVKYFYRPLNINANTIYNSTIYSYGGYSALITIGNGGTLDLKTDQIFYYNCCTGNATLSIAAGGTLTKTAGTGIAEIDWIVNNGGTVSASSGTIALAAGGASTGTFAPASGGNVRFAGGTHTVTGGASGSGTISVTGGTVTFNGPTYNAGTTDISGGAANFDAAASTANLSLSNSGTLGGTANLNVTGSFSWTGGTMSGTGSTTIAGTVTSSIIGGSSVKYFYRSLNIDASTVFSSTVYSYGGYNAAVTIGSGGTLDLLTDQVFYYNCCTGNAVLTVASGGTLAKTAGTGATHFDWIVNNNGTMSPSSGTIVLAAGGASSGTFAPASGGTVRFAGGTHTATGAVSGAGTINVTSGTVTFSSLTYAAGTTAISGGVANFDGTASTAALDLSIGGTLGGTGALTVTGSFSWSGGTMSGTGSTTIDGTVTSSVISGPYVKYFQRTLNINANTVYNATTYSYGGSGALITVGSGGTFDIQSDQTFYYLCCSTQATLSIAAGGTLKKSAGTGTASFDQWIVSNSGGTVLATSGTLGFYGGYTQTSGATQVAGATISSNTTLSIQGGTLGGTGTISANVNNTGAVVIPGGAAAAGLLNITGTYTQSPAAALAIELGGTTVGTQYDRLAVSGSVTLDGDLNVSAINSFLPASGNTFQVLTFASRPGPTDFANKNGLDFGFGTNLIPAYSATDLQLTTNTVQTDLAIAMTATPATLNAGDTFTYNITVTNNGGSNASGVAVSATLPANVTFVASTPAICTGSPNMVCSIGNLADQASTNIVITVDTTAGGSASMTAVVAGSQFDPIGANNSATAAASVTSHADLRVTLTNTAAPVAGATSSYSIVVTNDGPDTANAVSLSVTPTAGMTFASATGACAASGFPCALGNLANGQSVTINTTYDVPPSATGNAQLTASVAATSPVDLDSSDNSASVTNPIADEADVAVVKTGPTTVPAESGTTVTYTITVTNGGPSEASAVSLNDPTPNGLVLDSVSGACSAFPCSIGTLTVGQSSVTQVTYQIAGALGTTYTNTATVTSAADPNASNNQSSVSTTVSNCPAPAITAPATVNGGSTGNVASVTAVSGATYNWSISNGTITSGQGTTSITFSAGTSGAVGLAVTVSSGSCVANPSASVPIVSADVVVTKTGPATVSPVTDSSITYSIIVSNNGPSVAGSITLDDPTPAGLTLSGVSGACSAFPCTVGSLTASQSATVQVTYTFNASASSQTVTNQASATSSSTPDPNPSNNSGSATTVIQACPAITISGPSALEPGANGSASATNVSGATYSWSISNGSITGGQGTSAITFTAGTSGPGTLNVSVTAGLCTGAASHQFTVTTSQADVALVKSAPANVASGANFTYTLTVTNNGPSNADAVTVSDSLPSGVTFVSASPANCTGGATVNCSLGTLAVGASQVVTIDVTAPQGPATVVNTAAVTTSSVDTVSANNSSSVSTAVDAPPIQCPAAAPTLTAPADADANVVSPVTFSWTSVANATAYELWVGVNGGTLALVTTTTATTHTETLSSGTYAWQVIARGSGSCNPQSSVTRIFTIPQITQCPAAGPVLTAPADGDLSVTSPVTFAWSSVANATAYELWIGVDGGTLTLVTTTTSTTHSATLGSGTYAWQVVALGTGSCNAQSSVVRMFTIPQCPTATPALLSPANNADDLTSPVAFDWDAVAHATSYQLWVAPDGDSLALALTTSATDASLALPSGTFNWQVVAYGAQSCSARPSPIHSFTIPQIDTCGGNGVATGLSPSGETVTSPVTISWNAVPNAIGYVVRYRLGDDAFQDAGSTTGAISLTRAFPPGTITYVVDTLFAGCPATRSAEAAFTIDAPPSCEGVATLSQPANGTSTSDATIQFAWTPVSGSSGYRVWMQTGTAAAEVLASTLANSLTKVIPAGTHTWWVETLFPGCASRDSQHFTFTVLPAQNCEGRGRPDLITPSIGLVTASASVEFSWSAVAGAIEYELHLAPVGGVPTLVATTELTSATVEVAPGQLEWFVRALFNGCLPTESDHRQFAYEPPPNCTANQRAVLQSPAEGERVGSPITFDWNDVAGAASYQLFVGHGGQEPVLAATTTTSAASGIQAQLGAGRWFVRTTFGQGCTALDSTESRFVVVPPVAACSALEAPVVSAPGQISSGVNGLLQWSFVPGATRYLLEISTDPGFTPAATTSTDTGNNRQESFQFTNAFTAPIARYVRVRAIDTRCSPSNVGPFSETTIIYVLPATSAQGSSLIGEDALVEYTLNIGSEFAGESFTATPTQSWITVSPSTGIVPAGGQPLHVVVNTSGLSPGTNIGGVSVSTGASGRISTHGSTLTMPVSVSLVSPVAPTPKNTPPPDALVIPAVANADGIGSHFQSDVRVSNTSAQVMKYQLSYIPSGDAGITAGRQTTFSIEAGRTVALDDILKTWFGTGTASSIGSLEVRPLTEVAKSTSSAAVGALANLVTFASSRTFNVTPTGTFGQYIPAIPFANFVDKSRVLSLQQIAHSSQYRTNLGLVEGSGEPVSLLVKVFNSTGGKLTEFPVNLAGGQHTQLNGFLSTHGITSLDDGRVEVSVVSGNGKITAYASVLDNKTADPLLVSPVTLSDNGNTKWVVPGVADLNNGAANWQTDMRVFNAGSTPEQLTLSFYSQNGGAPKVTSMTLAPGEVRQLDKILSNTFGITQNGGSVHVASADSAKLIATARTYNQTTQGTYGQFIAAVTPAEAVGVGSRPLQLLQVEESSRYRSNIGLAEVSGKPVSLEVSIVPPDAKFTATVRVDLAANEFRQITSMLAGLGLGETYNARVTVRAIGGEGRATAYASVIDATTNDPTYVPAQ